MKPDIDIVMSQRTLDRIQQGEPVTLPVIADGRIVMARISAPMQVMSYADIRRRLDEAKSLLRIAADAISADTDNLDIVGAIHRYLEETL